MTECEEVMKQEIADLRAALTYSNKAREIMRAEKEHGWREADRWESRAEKTEAALADRDAKIAAVRALLTEWAEQAQIDRNTAEAVANGPAVQRRLSALADQLDECGLDLSRALGEEPK